MRLLTTTLFVSALTLSLASCRTGPNQNQLYSGMDKTQLSQNALKTRLATDPICVRFYSNATKYNKQVRSNRVGSSNIATGLYLASALRAKQSTPSGTANQSGTTAANAAATINNGSHIMLRALNPSKVNDVKVIEVANKIGCPVNIKR